MVPGQDIWTRYQKEGKYEQELLFDVEYIYGFVWWGVCKQSRWRHSVTEPEPEPEPEPSQDGGYVLLWQRYDNNKMVAMRYYANVILHLQQYSHRLNLLFLGGGGHGVI